MGGEKEKSIEEKAFAFVATAFCGYTCIRLIWFDIFVERVNREEKSRTDWTNHINTIYLNLSNTIYLTKKLKVEKAPQSHNVVAHI